MADKPKVRREVREFYDQVGWQKVGLLQENLQGIYENTLYEDLRPVAREYIHKCHLRINRHLSPRGRFLLDAGSGPVQYPEYVEYSRNYQGRVCADISITALQEARRHLGEHGLYVVADIASLPFKKDAFDGLVSLHTIHHLPKEEHPGAYRELFRVLAPAHNGVVVVGWQRPILIKIFNFPHRLRKRLQGFFRKFKRAGKVDKEKKPSKGTYHEKYTAAWLKKELAGQVPIDILVWRSVGVRTMRLYIHQALGGKYLLRLVYALEELFPRFFGEKGTYPLIVMHKDENAK